MSGRKPCDDILYVIKKNQTYSPEEFRLESPNLKPCCKIDEFAQNESQDFEPKFLKAINELSVLIVRILIAAGIKKCQACRGFESIKQALLYYDGVPHKQMCSIKRRIRKATLFNNLGRDAKMTAKEASLTYVVLKNIFKTFYETIGPEYETGFCKLSMWNHTAKKIATIYNQESYGDDPGLDLKIMCLMKKFLFAMMKNSCCESLQVPTKCYNLDCPSCYKNLTKKFFGKSTLDGFSLNSTEKVFFDPFKMDEEILKNNASDKYKNNGKQFLPECQNIQPNPCGDNLWDPPKYTKKVQAVKKMRCRPKAIKRTSSEKVVIKFRCEAMTPSDQSLENPCCNFDLVRCKKTGVGNRNQILRTSVETVHCGDMLMVEKRAPSRNKCYQTFKTDFLFCDCKKVLNAKKSSTQIIDKLLSDFIIELMDQLGILREDSDMRIHAAFMSEWESYIRRAEEAEQSYHLQPLQTSKDYKCGGLRYYNELMELKELEELHRKHGGGDLIPAGVRIIPRSDDKTELEIHLFDGGIGDGEEVSILKVFGKEDDEKRMYSCEPFLYSRRGVDS